MHNALATPLRWGDGILGAARASGEDDSIYSVEITSLQQHWGRRSEHRLFRRLQDGSSATDGGPVLHRPTFGTRLGLFRALGARSQESGPLTDQALF